MLAGSPRRPVDWIKKWFLRKRKADGKNRTLTPTEPTFAENEPPTHGCQVLGHAHSKFWSVDAFAAADSTSFSPSAGHIPKFYGHRTRRLPPGKATDSRGNEEETAASSTGTSTETGYSCVVPSDPVLTCGNTEITTSASYDLREVLLGADAFVGYVSPSVNEDASGSPTSDHLDVTLTVDDPGSTLLLPAASSPERFAYLDSTYGGGSSNSESIIDLEFSLTNYPIASVSSPLGATDGFTPALGDLDFTSATSCSTSDDLELSAFDSTTGCLDSDLGSLPRFANVPSYTTSILGESSAFYQSLLLGTEQDPMEGSIDATGCSSLLGIDVCLEAGADHFAFVLTGFEFRE